IIRNAVDHGIESPGERRAAGKREAGMLTVSARQTGNTIHIGIMDDGRGIDCDRLSQKAIAAGIITAERAAEMTRAEKIELMFELFGASQDRKSTRLNSSHVKISYAVFCLKKKKKDVK